MNEELPVHQRGARDDQRRAARAHRRAQPGQRLPGGDPDVARLGVAVLDAQQLVQIWNRHAEDLWGLRSEEAVDHHFLNLDIGLPAEELAPALRAVLGGTSRARDPRAASRQPARSLDPVRRDGAAADQRVGDEENGVRGAIVMMEDRPRDGGGGDG